MNVTITPTKLMGAVTPPSSKSQAHRLLIAAALAHGVSTIHNVTPSEDISATLWCLSELGAVVEESPHAITVHGMEATAMSPNRRMGLPHLDCGESGSTLRFLIPVALAVRGGGVFTGRGRLMERPLTPYFRLFEEKGIFYELADGVLTVQGQLTPGVYRLPGDVSSQFFTGLLFALPLLDGPSALIPTTPLESEGYVTMTLRALHQFGVDFPVTMSLPPQYHPGGQQRYLADDPLVEGDWSQAGFWYAANSLGSDVDILSLDPDSPQGDKVVLQHHLNLAQPGDAAIDLTDCPDLAPPLAVMAAVRQGATHFTNAGRLRLKESDRLSVIAEVLCKLGGRVTEGESSFTVEGVPALAGGVTVDAHNDHRIAMMAAIAAIACEKPVTITGAQCVKKSYPSFWNDYVNLGGRLHWSD